MAPQLGPGLMIEAAQSFETFVELVHFNISRYSKSKVAVHPVAGYKGPGGVEV
jgi:hypothetical protein